jgi:hypothetical protein
VKKINSKLFLGQPTHAWVNIERKQREMLEKVICRRRKKDESDAM